MRCSHLRRWGSWLRGCHDNLAVIIRFLSAASSSSGLGEQLIVEQVADALLLVAQEGIHLRYVVEMDSGGSDERERGQAGRVAHRRLRGNPAAERTPDEMDTGEVEL